MCDQRSTPQSNQLYHSYLLRLWQGDPQTPWRILAQSIQSGETRHFADLESFFAFLQAQTTNEQSTISSILPACPATLPIRACRCPA